MTVMRITRPNDLSDKIEVQTGDRLVPHQVSNFGFVDYQGSINLQVFRWPGEDPCKLPENIDEVRDRVRKQVQGETKFAFIVEYAGLKCTVATQAFNMMKLGANTGLVYVAKNMHPQSMTTFVNIKDGIRYPPMNFIGHDQGVLILDSINSGSNVQINIDYEMRKYEGNLTVVYWYAFDHTESLAIMRYMIQKQVPLRNFVDFNYIFKMYSAEEIGLDGASRSKIQRYCYGAGTYCIKPSEIISKLKNPRELLLEGLKLTCITETAEKYFLLNALASGYIDDLRIKCMEKDDIENCSQDLLAFFKNAIKNDKDAFAEFEGCLNEVEKIKNQPEEMHAALDYVHVQNHQYGKYDVVPSLFVNNQLVGGTLTGALAISAVCDSLKSPPEYCKALEQQIRGLRDEDRGEIEGELIQVKGVGLFFVKFLVVVGSIGLLAVLLILGLKFYEFNIKRDIDAETYMQINAVERLPPMRTHQMETLEASA